MKIFAPMVLQLLTRSRGRLADKAISVAAEELYNYIGQNNISSLFTKLIRRAFGNS